MLIPRLFTQSNELHVKKRTRKATSDLTRNVKECQFNVLEQDYDKVDRESNINLAQATDHQKEPAKPENAETSLFQPSIAFSPGLKKSGVFYKVVSNKKREPLP